MVNYCNYFKNKKITIMGFGVLGRGVNVAKFLAECGADLTITDLKTEKELASSLAKLKKFTNIKYALEKHELVDFRNKDIIIKAASVPLDSPYIEEAEKDGAEIEMDASLFCKLIEGVITIGITGTKGKSTVSRLIFEILKSQKTILGKKRNIFLAGNVRGAATLSLLKKIKEGDIIVLELDSWQLQGFHDAKLSPRFAVFTNFMPDHMNYYKGDIKKYFEDKTAIFKYQNKNDILVLGENFLRQIKTLRLYALFKKFITLRATTRRVEKQARGEIILSGKKDIPKNWLTRIKVLGKHNLENIAAAISVCECLGIKKLEMKDVIQNFCGESGRLEFIKEIRGIKFYNDTTATTPEAAIASIIALQQNYLKVSAPSFQEQRKIVLIGGGADKGLDYKEYARAVKKYVKTLILFQGAASEKIIKALGVRNNKFKKNSLSFFTEIKSMKEAMKIAFVSAKKGDIILLSPGAASFGVFKNEFDRGEQFNRIIQAMR